MNAYRTIRTARTRVYRRHRGLTVGAGFLCLCAFSPLAMASSMLLGVDGPGKVTFSLLSDGSTRFGFNFNGSDAGNRVSFLDDPDGVSDEAFNITLSLASAPALSGTNGPDTETGTGILTLRWEQNGLNTASAPADSDWSGSDSIIRLFGGASVALLESNTGTGFYEAVLGFTNPAAASAASISYEWANFNDPAGSNFSIVLDPGLQDLPVASAVPIPPAVWLFAGGLMALVGIGRRRSG